MIQLLLTTCLLLATPAKAAVFPALSYEQAIQLPPQDREEYFEILQSYYIERERHETATGWGFLLELLHTSAIASPASRECTDPTFNTKNSQWTFECVYYNRRGRSERKRYFTIGEDREDFKQLVKKFANNPSKVKLPSPVYEQALKSPRRIPTQVATPEPGKVRVVKPFETGLGTIYESNSVAHQLALNEAEAERRNQQAEAYGLLREKPRTTVASSTAKTKNEPNKTDNVQSLNLEGLGEMGAVEVASSPSNPPSEEPIPELRLASATLPTTKDNVQNSQTNRRELGATKTRLAAGAKEPEKEEGSAGDVILDDKTGGKLDPLKGPPVIDPEKKSADLQSNTPINPAEQSGAGEKTTSPPARSQDPKENVQQQPTANPKPETFSQSQAGPTSRNAGARDRRLAAADALEDADGDCVNAGFNFLKPKGGRKGYCRGISSICGASKEQSVRSVPPMSEYEKLFCEGNDRSAGRCDEKSDDIFNLNVVCDPMTFGVAQTNSGAPKVICVARGRNNSQKCKERAVAVGAKFLCPSTAAASTGSRGPATGPSSNSNKPGELATQATAHKKIDCVPTKGNSSRLYNQKILAMARECGWGNDPLTKKGTPAHKNRSAKAKQDISEACRNVEPKLLAFRESLASRTDVKHILDEIGKKPVETLPGPAPARPSTLPPPPEPRPTGGVN